MPGDTRAVRARLSLDVAQAIGNADRFGATMERNAARAERAGARVDRSSAKTGRAWETVGRGARNTFLVGAAGLGVLERANYTFDKSMGSVNAATHANAQVMEEYRSAAVKAGADTVFSASEAAQGITELAKAGVDAKDILGGGLTGALNLASAGSIGVGQAAEYMATALTQFQLDGTKASHVADLLAAGAGKAQGEVSDMALALNYAGVPASQLGVSIEQTTGTIALLAKNGIIGEKAGTSLRGMLASLTSPSKVAAKEMASLGISVFDAKGNFIGFDGVAKVLHQRLGGLTQQERSYALGRIFGNEQLQAANVLYREGAKGVHTWTKNVDDSGYAADTAKRKLNNLAGDVEYLKGDLDSLFIKRGSGAQDGLRDLVQGADRAVTAFSHLPDAVQSGVVKVTALATATAGVLYVASKVVRAYRDVRGLFPSGALGKAETSVASKVAGAVGSRVFVTNWPPGLVAPGRPVTAFPTKAGMKAAAPAAGAAAAAAKWTTGRVVGGGLVAYLAAAANAKLDEALGKLGSKGNESGILSQFLKPKGGGFGDGSKPLGADFLFGKGHTVSHDLQAALNAQKLGGVGAKADQFLAGLVGGDGLTKSLGNVKKLDVALSHLTSKDKAAGAKAYDEVLKKSNLTADQLNKVLPKTAAAMDKYGVSADRAGKAQLDANGHLKAGTALFGAGGVDVSKYADKLQLLPKAVQKAVLNGKATTDKEIGALTRKFDLTPIQVKALVTLAGGKEAISEAHRTALKIARELDMSRPDKADRPKTPEVGPIKGGTQNLLLNPVMDTSKFSAVIADYKRQLRNLPDGVMTKISTPGAVQSIGQVRSLARQYNLTPKQVRTLVTVLNLALAKAGLRGLSGDLDNVGGKRPKPKVKVDPGNSAAILAGLRAGLAALHDKSIHIGINTTRNTSGGNAPGGGASTGSDGATVPKTGRNYADRHLYLLADGEEVISNRYGQADRFRADRAAGKIPGYADGGSVGVGTTTYATAPGITVTFPSPTAYATATAAADSIAADAVKTSDYMAKAATATGKYVASAAEIRGVKLDDLHLSQQISQTTKSLAEHNDKTIKVKNKHGKGTHEKTLKGKGGYTLTGIDRTTALAELADLKAQQKETRKQNAIQKAQADARQEILDEQKQNAADAAEAFKQAQDDAVKAQQQARTDAQNTLTGATDLFSRGSSGKAVLASSNRDLRDIAQAGQNLAALKDRGASAALLNLVMAKVNAGDFATANKLARSLLDSPTLLGQLNASLGARESAAAAVANFTTDPRFLASAAWNPTALAPNLVQVQLAADPSTWMTELTARVTHAVVTQLAS